jgi:acyl-CoA hydrolase
MHPFEHILTKNNAELPRDITQGRSIAYSRSNTTRMMGLLDANGQGNVHGGVIMHMVDEAAAIVAMKHSQCSRVVTAHVETFDFLAPAFIGDVVSIPCEIQYVGRTSMEVGVKVLAENPRTGEVRHVASSQLIYVALDDQGRPTPVPPLVPADEAEQKIIEQARKRRLYRQRVKEELARTEEGQP